MIEPVLALQNAIHTRLVGKPDVMALLEDDPTRVRSSSTRPDKFPSIRISDGTTTLHGNDYRSQMAAWVYLDLHVWTLDAGQNAAKEIAGTVAAALSKYNLPIEGGYCDHFKVTASRLRLSPWSDHRTFRLLHE